MLSTPNRSILPPNMGRCANTFEGNVDWSRAALDKILVGVPRLKIILAPGTKASNQAIPTTFIQLDYV